MEGKFYIVCKNVVEFLKSKEKITIKEFYDYTLLECKKYSNLIVDELNMISQVWHALNFNRVIRVDYTEKGFERAPIKQEGYVSLQNGFDDKFVKNSEIYAKF